MNENKLFEELQKDILNSFYREVEKLTERIGLILERETKDVLSKHGKYATGDLYKSIRSKVIKLSKSYVIRCFAGVNYSQFVHEDTRPHFPPINKIQKWVRLKKLTGRYSVKSKRRLGGKQTQHDEDRALAWIIARSIARKGTKGIKFFELALKQAMPIIEKEIAVFKV